MCPILARWPAASRRKTAGSRYCVRRSGNEVLRTPAPARPCRPRPLLSPTPSPTRTHRARPILLTTSPSPPLLSASPLRFSSALLPLPFWACVSCKHTVLSSPSLESLWTATTRCRSRLLPLVFPYRDIFEIFRHIPSACPSDPGSPVNRRLSSRALNTLLSATACRGRRSTPPGPFTIQPRSLALCIHLNPAPAVPALSPTPPDRPPAKHPPES